MRGPSRDQDKSVDSVSLYHNLLGRGPEAILGLL
jgi:hypothetical protein